MPQFAVIVPGAGKSERFEGKEKKTFAKLDGRPVFLRTLERFVTRDDVCQTIFSVAPEDLEMVKTKFGANLGFMGVQLVKGGAVRAESIVNALGQLKDEVEFVAVHDAARPCITNEWIDAVFAESRKTGAAILASPVNATLKRVSEAGVVDNTMPRESLFEAQTPQVFRREWIVDAYDQQKDTLGELTDDSMAVERAGHAVSIVKADVSNLKITTRGDLAVASAIIKTRPRTAGPKLGAFEEAQW